MSNCLCIASKTQQKPRKKEVPKAKAYTLSWQNSLTQKERVKGMWISQAIEMHI